MTQVWYPAFNLKENPFRYFEAAQERHLDEVYPLEVPMIETVKSYLNAGVNCLIVGQRGCGKSSVILKIKMDHSKSPQMIFIPAPRSLGDLVRELYQRIEFQYEEETRQAVSEVWGRGDYPDWFSFKMQACKICKRHCRIIRSTSPTAYAKSLNMILGECPSREKLLLHMFRDFSIIDDQLKMLVDVPDNLTGREVSRLVNLATQILSSDVLVLMATPNQAVLLKQFDVFARFPIVEWKDPAPSFFIELFKDRIKSFTVENLQPRYPFSDEVIEELARVSNYNCREFIRLCNVVLIDMWSRKSEKPYGLEELKELKFLKELKDQKTPFSLERALDEALTEFQPGNWVKLKHIREILNGQYHISLSAGSLGRILTKRGLPKRYNPDAEYLTPLPSDKPP